MYLNLLKETSTAVEPLLLAGTLWALARSKAYRGLPAFSAYLACRLAVVAPLLLLVYGARLHLVDRRLAYAVYYYVYWVGYLVGAGLALLVVHEIFGFLMRPLTGLGRYASMAFRWVTLISVLVAMALALYPAGTGRNAQAAPLAAALVSLSSGAMRFMSLLELCLLAFIALSMQTLRISPRSREFGVALGLGLIAAADLFGSAFAFGHSTLATVAAYGAQAAVTLGAAVWLVYFAAPRRKPSPVRGLPTPLRRWNEVAEAFADPAPQYALSPAPRNSFLQDVERAVDRVLERNSGAQGPL